MIKNNKYVFCIVVIFNIFVWVDSAQSASTQRDICCKIEILLPYKSTLPGLYKKYDVEEFFENSNLEEVIYEQADNGVISAETLRSEISDAVKSYYKTPIESFWCTSDIQTLLWLFTSFDHAGRLQLLQCWVLLTQENLAVLLRPDE